MRWPRRRPRRGAIGVLLPLEAGEAAAEMLARVEDAELALRLRVRRAVAVDTDRASGLPRPRSELSREVRTGALVGLTWGCIGGAGTLGRASEAQTPGGLAFWLFLLLILLNCAFFTLVGGLAGALVRRRAMASEGLLELLDDVPPGQRAVLLSVRHGDGHPLVEAVAPVDGRVVTLRSSTRPGQPRKASRRDVSRRTRVATAAAWTAAVLAFGYAAVSFYWAAGGTVALDTIGGTIEDLARRGGVVAATLALGAALAKLVGGLLALALVQPWARRLPRRPLRWLAWVAGIGLVVYGAVYVGAGVLALVGAVAPHEVDPHVLRWHVAVWDLWFLLWGAALLVAVWCTRPSPTRPAVA